mgnify:CR=1 FL=1
MSAKTENPKIPARGANKADRELPENIRQAVKILNSPKHYAREYDWVERKVENYDGRVPLRERIHAKAEWIGTQDAWVLYVEWDDFEPLTAKHLVHAAQKELRIPYFHSGGSTTTHTYEDGEKIQKFGRDNAEGAYLRVGNMPKR